MCLAYLNAWFENTLGFYINSIPNPFKGQRLHRRCGICFSEAVCYVTSDMSPLCYHTEDCDLSLCPLTPHWMNEIMRIYWEKQVPQLCWLGTNFLQLSFVSGNSYTTYTYNHYCMSRINNTKLSSDNVNLLLRNNGYITIQVNNSYCLYELIYLTHLFFGIINFYENRLSTC